MKRKICNRTYFIEKFVSLTYNLLNISLQGKQASICSLILDSTEVRGGSGLSPCPMQSQLAHCHLLMFLQCHVANTQAEPKCNINSPSAL